jgi:hypothetical protein
MINNSTIINKTNSHLSPQIIKHIKDHDICWGFKPVNGRRGWVGQWVRSLDLTAHTSLSVANLTTIRWWPGRALGIDSHYILIIEFLKLLLSVFMLSFILVIACDLCELKQIWWFICILPLQIQLSRMNEFWCLTPLSAIFQLYHGEQFYWWRKPVYPERTTDPGKATGKLYQLRLRVECTLLLSTKRTVTSHFKSLNT